MNFVAQCQATGRLFSSSAGLVAEAQLMQGIARGTDFLAGQIQAAAPVDTGELKKSVRTIGVGAGRGVRVQEWYAIPIEAGQKPGKWLNKKGLEKMTAWGERKLGLDPAAARRFAFAFSWTRRRWGLPKKRFFYGTYDRLVPYIQHHYLGQIASLTVKELDK